MITFDEIAQLHNTVLEAEKSLNEFNEYALYELDGGCLMWFDVKSKCRANIKRQKSFIQKLISENSDLTDAQQALVTSWNLEKEQ